MPVQVAGVDRHGGGVTAVDCRSRAARSAAHHRPGSFTEVLTEHYCRAHPEALGLVGAENLCHQAIFMNHAPCAVTPLDPELIQVCNAVG